MRCFTIVLMAMWLGAAAFLGGCRPSGGETQNHDSDHVQIRETAQGDRLYVHGEPFYVRGGCIVAVDHIPFLAQAGGNTIRTYPGIDLDSVFAWADSFGLMVIPGLEVTPMRRGLDYRDSMQVRRMKERVRQQVLRYRNHPALLMWGLGNEVHLLASQTEDEIFATIDDLARMVHELDPAHPTTYMTNGPTGAYKVWSKCEALDVLSVNTFRSLRKLKDILHWGGAVIDMPILISEWAPVGYWNSPTTSWGAPIELFGERRVKAYAHQYEAFLSEASGNLIGSCLFLWGQKQEHTHTWFSSFSEAGEPTGLVDEMARLWTGQYPENRAPIPQAIQVGSFQAGEEIILHQGEPYQAIAWVEDPEEDSLTISWEITQEFDRRLITGGDAESRPSALPGLLLSQRQDTLYFQAPTDIGAYRLFLYARDGKGKIGMMNLPFFVLKAPSLTGQ